MKAAKSDAHFEFSIIAGEFKGRVFRAPNLGITRPPLSRLRKSIFDFLNPYLPEASYLDLFSGTGSYLLEAVSRGAAAAVGVELDLTLAETINGHAAKLGVTKQLSCLVEDVFQAIPRLSAQKKKFDIIMIAPPQYKGLIVQTLKTLEKYPVHGTETLVICQHDTSETKKINWQSFTTLQQRKYGNTTFTILKGGAEKF